MLVEDYLVAVVSLPPGVFNPYSGVKTSILILDRSLARRSTTIGFFKVEADGFDLGAQRREIDRNDLPAVKGEVVEYLRWVRDGDWVDEYSPEHGLVVEKERIGADGDFNLSGERYADSIVVASKFPYVDVEEILQRSKQTVSPATLNGIVTYIGLENLEPHTGRLVGRFVENDPTSIKSSKNVFGSGDILYGKLRPNLNKVWFADRNGICSSDIFVIQPKNGDVEPKFYEHVFRSKQFNDEALKRLSGAQLPRINWQSLAGIEVPLPPLDVQREIVSEIEGYQKVIDGARAVVENWRPRIAVDPEWPVVQLGEVASVQSGFGFPKAYQGLADEEIPFLKVSDMNLPGNEIDMWHCNHTVSRTTLSKLKGKALPKGTVIFPKIGAAIATNKKRVLTRDSTYDNNVMGIMPKSEYLVSGFLHTYLTGIDLSDWASNAQPPSMRKTTVERHQIPLPPISEQEFIVAEIEAERELVEGSRRLIERMEGKVREVVGRVWDGN